MRTFGQLEDSLFAALEAQIVSLFDQLCRASGGSTRDNEAAWDAFYNSFWRAAKLHGDALAMVRRADAIVDAESLAASKVQSSAAMEAAVEKIYDVADASSLPPQPAMRDAAVTLFDKATLDRTSAQERLYLFGEG